MNYLLPFSVLKSGMRLLSVKGQLKVDMNYDEFLDMVKKFLRAVPLDEEWYCNSYPDVAEAIKAGAYRSARQHFVDHGYFEGRRPFELFIDERWYMEQYPDIKESVANGSLPSALDHFRNNGYEEGRLPSDL